MKLVFDIETDGLLDDVSKIHCIVIGNLETRKFLTFSPGEIEKGLDVLSQASLLVGHNIDGYDLPAIRNLYPGFTFSGKTYDTLPAARTIKCDIIEADLKSNLPPKLRGRHSLEAWGQRLGILKGDYGKQDDAWDTFTPEMLEYCKQDVLVSIRLYEYLVAQDYPEHVVEFEQHFNRLMLEQEWRGFEFDEEAAAKLYGQLVARKDELTAQLEEMFEPTIIELKTKTKTIPFNPASRQQIADRLIKRGWKPKDLTETGQPKVDETTLKSLTLPGAQELVEYLMLNKRLGQLGSGKQAWLKLAKNGRIHGRVNHMGAVTSRCTHQNPNVAQVPSMTAEFGKECRELFKVPEGHELVGCDASGLELRCLAHFMHRWDKGAYGKEILDGDIHTANQKAAGLETRPQAKTFIYAFLYGAGDGKIGSITGGGTKQGKAIKAKFFKAIPAIANLKEAVGAQAVKGFIKGLDGRRVPVRSEHAALNTLLQSAGALICKYWYVEIVKGLEKAGLSDKARVVAFVHDEVQIEVKKGYGEEVGAVCQSAIKAVEKIFSFRIPLDAEYSVGRNWAETH